MEGQEVREEEEEIVAYFIDGWVLSIGDDVEGRFHDPVANQWLEFKGIVSHFEFKNRKVVSFTCDGIPIPLDNATEVRISFHRKQKRI